MTAIDRKKKREIVLSVFINHNLLQKTGNF